MNARAHRSAVLWRWILIASEVLVATYLIMGFVLVSVGGRHARFSAGPSLVIGVLASLACFFLLFGSPFLVRRHGPLAIAGWFIGAAALFLSAGY